MKKSISSLCFATLMAASGAAMAEGAYVALDAGQTNYGTCVSTNPAVTVTSCSNKPSSYSIGGGYNFSKNFGVEANYTDYGNGNFAGAVRGVPYSATYNTTAFQIAGTGTLPLSESFSLTAKLGAAFASTKATATALGVSAAATKSNTVLVGGIGAEYDFTNSVGIRVNYEALGQVGDANTGTSSPTRLSAGVVFKF